MESPVLPLNPLDKLLLDCLHQEGSRRKAILSAPLNAEQWDAFVSIAIRRHVAAPLFYRLRLEGGLSVLPETLQQVLWKHYMVNSARNLSLFNSLKKVLKAFQAEDIPVIVLKGAHLAHTVYENSSVRAMSDIDLLVQPDMLSAADGVLTHLGYLPKSQSDIDFELKHFAHLPAYHKSGAPLIELHWTIINPKPPCRFETSEFWRDTEHFQILELDVKGLSRELLLLHVCTHISHHHGFRTDLRSYLDIAEVLHRYGAGLDWQLFEGIAVRAGVKRGVFLSLFLARELLGAGVPDDRLERLEPSSMDERILKTALNRCLSDNAQDQPMGLEAEILEKKGLWRKAKGMAQHVFKPRKWIARAYGLPPDSWYFFIYYPVRLMDLIRRHKRTVWDYMQKDEHTRSKVRDGKLFEDWVCEK